jgi:ElaB/YqjD/DUF883 family membrane-anchored ribosome-binding protein
VSALDRYLDEQADASRAAMLARVERAVATASEECERAVDANPWIALGSALAVGMVLTTSVGRASSQSAVRTAGRLRRIWQLL